MDPRHISPVLPITERRHYQRCNSCSRLGLHIIPLRYTVTDRRACGLYHRGIASCRVKHIPLPIFTGITYFKKDIYYMNNIIVSIAPHRSPLFSRPRRLSKVPEFCSSARTISPLDQSSGNLVITLCPIRCSSLGPNADRSAGLHFSSSILSG